LTHAVMQPELRYRRSWLTGGIAMVLIITVVCLLPSTELPSTGLSDKTEHFLAFGALAFWFGSIVVRRDLPWVFVAVVAFGGLIEFLQSAMGLGRQGDLLDLAAESIGVAIGVLLALTPLGRWSLWVEQQVAKLRTPGARA
jgi:VanZ family protein